MESVARRDRRGAVPAAGCGRRASDDGRLCLGLTEQWVSASEFGAARASRAGQPRVSTISSRTSRSSKSDGRRWRRAAGSLDAGGSEGATAAAADPQPRATTGAVSPRTATSNQPCPQASKPEPTQLSADRTASLSVHASRGPILRSAPGEPTLRDGQLVGRVPRPHISSCPTVRCRP